MIDQPRIGPTVCILAIFQTSLAVQWVVMEKYGEADTTCSGSPTKQVNPWAPEDTCLSVGSAGLRDWMVQGGDGSQELYVKVTCTDEDLTETVYSDQDCTTLAVSGNGKNSSVQRSRSCADHSPPWSFMEKYGYTKFQCGNEFPLISWGEFSDENCQTRKDTGVTYEAVGGCYSLEGVENWIGDGMNSKKVACSSGSVAWLHYASSDCSGEIVLTSAITAGATPGASATCTHSILRDAYIKIIDGECVSPAASATLALNQGSSFLALFSLVLALTPLMLPQEQRR